VRRLDRVPHLFSSPSEGSWATWMDPRVLLTPLVGSAVASGRVRRLPARPRVSPDNRTTGAGYVGREDEVSFTSRRPHATHAPRPRTASPRPRPRQRRHARRERRQHRADSAVGHRVRRTPRRRGSAALAYATG